MMAIKEGPLLWALDKDATVVQRTYGVLQPQLLLIYSNEEESSFNRTKPLRFFDLQQCFAVQPTNQYPDFFGIMLMIVPGEVSLLGFSTAIKRREWMEVINEAMDTEVMSAELRELIDTLQERQEIPSVVAKADERSGNGGSNHSSLDQLTMSSPSSQVVQLTESKQSEDRVTFSCPPLKLIDSPLLKSPIEASPVEDVRCCQKGCLDEVNDTLSKIHPILFDCEKEEHQQPQQGYPLKKAVVNGYAKDPPEKTAKSMSEAETILKNFQSLSKILISQEAVNSVLTDSCSNLKETLKMLSERLRLGGIEVELSFSQAPTPSNRQPSKGGSSLQDIPNASKSCRSADTSSVIRRQRYQVRQPGQTASLVVFEDQSFLSPGPDTFSTGTSSTQTLVAPAPTDGPVYSDSHSVGVVCSHCLKILSAGILEISMNLITSHTSPSPQTIRRVCALASCLHSYLSGHIAAIRNRTNFPNDILVTGLAKLALNDPNAPPMVQTLVESVAAEVCGQILEEMGKEKTKGAAAAHLINGLSMDWFNAIPEKQDLKWMLPGYIATCLMLHRLSDSGVKIIKNHEKLMDPSLTNGNLHDTQVQDVLEALSTTLSRSICHEKYEYPSPNDSYLQLGVEFESVFFELLMREYGKGALEVILPETVDSRNANSDKLFSSKVQRPDDILIPDERRSAFAHDDLNDRAFQKQSALSPDVNDALNELKGLSDHLLQSRRAFYERAQNKEAARVSQGADQDIEDYANVISALRREYEEEKQRLLQDINQNWFHRDYYDAYTVESELHLKSLHSQLNRLCATTVSNTDRGKDLGSAAARLAKAQKIILSIAPPRKPSGGVSHVILLNQVENAISIFSKFVNSTVDRQEGLEDNDFNDLSARVPEALAGLAAAVNDLRARLYCDVGDDDFNDVDTVGERNEELRDFPEDCEDRDGHPRKPGPSPLGFTINLVDSEDPDEINESEI
ncbi:hypothetical protein EGR_01157 [Echinococcus granulosus]|uniref:PH domain-containing protein n=1 Tax=Echinococcus granulosus TaxID=6210 RepID=W6VB76_ECHGR|nr:hypothetical protein EGR_01157 [Echinococcus granulosus]EUB64029.1 hypothetical protein EGR_01157 [Echinococcus granulosus]